MPRTHAYAPMHAMKHHPLATWLKLYQNDAVAAMNQTIAEAKKFRIDHPQDDLELKVITHAHQEAAKGTLKSCNGPRYIGETTDLIQSLGLWSQNGRKIYEFGSELTNELLHTEIHEVTGNDLKTPMPCFYLAFDMDQPYTLPDGLLLDGILIIISTSDYPAATTTSPNPAKKDETQINLIFMPRPGDYDMTKTPLVINLPIYHADDIIEKQFLKIIDGYKSSFNHWHTKDLRKNNKNTDEALSDIGERIQHREKVFTDLYQLIAGALLFLSIYHDKGNEGWSPNAPQKFVDKLSGQKEEAKKAANWLEEKGWSRSTFFNINSPGNQHGSSVSGEQVATHWRSGHWRQVPVGPNRCERRLTWIRPVLVNADKGMIQDKTLIISVNRPA